MAETEDALAQTGGRGLIIAARCVLPMETPDPNIAAVVRRLGGPLRPVPGAVFRRACSTAGSDCATVPRVAE